MNFIEHENTCNNGKISNKIKIEVFSDYTWPWCYFATGSIEKLKNEYGVHIKWRAFPLHTDIPEQGRTLEELLHKKGLLVNVDEIMAKLQLTATKFGVALADNRMTYNSRLAQEIGLWAETKDKGHQFHMEAFKAYFAEGQNIYDKKVLLSLMDRSGLDLEEGVNVIQTRAFSDAVDSDWALSKTKNVIAAPTFFMGTDRLVGAQSYEALKKLVDRHFL